MPKYTIGGAVIIAALVTSVAVFMTPAQDTVSAPAIIPTSTPPTQAPPPTLVHRLAPTPTPVHTTPTLEAPETPTPTPNQTSELTLSTITVELLAPSEGANVEIGAVRVLGLTDPGAAVTVNGRAVDVRRDGSFQHDLLLSEGLNPIEVTAVGPQGQTAYENAVVLFIPRGRGIPLSLLYPAGLEVHQPSITVVGATRPDVVVGVNGVPVDVNAYGIFSTTVSLEEGVNLVEVVAVDLEENVNYQSLVVFFIPRDG